MFFVECGPHSLDTLDIACEKKVFFSFFFLARSPGVTMMMYGARSFLELET